eukprot:TRINITY_DN1497_c1_g1_i2.p1 TRINITY_DN1497_c1_g1~~TRINITY_DN1497_c1_g1_i2.p1  ORF type:complete len:472 (+),score=143.72 TRINITY_DN1497_c1_g1_i2:163-1578(+)
MTAEGDEATSLTPIQKTKILFEISNSLQDLQIIGEVCDADAVTIIAPLLSDANSQLRKYASLILSELAISLKGQIAIMSDDILPRVIQMIKDPMPNVVSAACQCLLKISSLYCGSHALLSRNVHLLLEEVICSQKLDLVIKARAVETILSMYSICPGAEKVDSLVTPLYKELSATKDQKYKNSILQLLDVWEEELPSIALSERTTNHIAALKAVKMIGDEKGEPDIEARTAAASYLLSDLVSHPEIVLELVDGGGVEQITDLISLEPDNGYRLQRYAYQVLSVVANSHFGRKKLIRFRVMSMALDTIGRNVTASDVLYVYHAARFLEVAVQYQDTRQRLLSQLNGVSKVCEFVIKHYRVNHLLCLPALGILRFVVLLEAGLREELREKGEVLDTLRTFALSSACRGQLRDRAWSALQLLLSSHPHHHHHDDDTPPAVACDPAAPSEPARDPAAAAAAATAASSAPTPSSRG